ncbi:hypothetical protein HPHPP26_1637 [Helicobacter pylori Hp P-26]|nr:hypothetical protein HPHPP26_1637 [Helicobacter pylori Hp P-26]
MTHAQAMIYLSNFDQHSLIDAKLALKRTLVLKNLFQYEILVSCKNAKFQKTNKQPP